MQSCNAQQTDTMARSLGGEEHGGGEAASGEGLVRGARQQWSRYRRVYDPTDDAKPVSPQRHGQRAALAAADREQQRAGLWRAASRGQRRECFGIAGGALDLSEARRAGPCSSGIADDEQLQVAMAFRQSRDGTAAGDQHRLHGPGRRYRRAQQQDLEQRRDDWAKAHGSDARGSFAGRRLGSRDQNAATSLS